MNGRREPADVVTLPYAALPAAGRFADLSPEKLRGGYYTPAQIANWLAKWAVRTRHDRVLEPSCGDGRILQAALSRLLALGAAPRAAAETARGIELIPEEAERARAHIRPLLGARSDKVVEAGDFFAWRIESNVRQFTSVLGNPPFIRYQSFPEPSRSRAMKLMEDVGLRPNRLTNIWVPFVVGATEALEPGGRLALVVPAELLQVSYAAQLRAYLTERFQGVGLIACNELLFDGAEQEVLLLLADGALPRRVPGHRCQVSLVQVATVDDVLRSDPAALLAAQEHKDVHGDSEKWLKYFLTAREIEFMRELRRHPRVTTLSSFAQVDVGVVTGKNAFFVLRKSEAVARAVEGMTVRLVSRSAHLRGAVVSIDDWEALARRDDRVHLVNIRQEDGEVLRGAAAEYVRYGESLCFHEGYKCRIRHLWFHVPAMWVPDGFLFRQIHDFPRFVRNQAGATCTDTIHRFMVRDCDPDALVAGTYTYLTAASAEIEGRSYGGGVLELEPTEAERLLVPQTLNDAVALPDADAYVRKGKLEALLIENNRALRRSVGLSAKDCGLLKQIWEKLRDRRFARNKKQQKDRHPMPGLLSLRSAETSTASSTP
jgi:adenine-specific DNA-methyltransferase